MEGLDLIDCFFLQTRSVAKKNLWPDLCFKSKTLKKHGCKGVTVLIFIGYVLFFEMPGFDSKGAFLLKAHRN